MHAPTPGDVQVHDVWGRRMALANGAHRFVDKHAVGAQKGRSAEQMPEDGVDQAFCAWQGGRRPAAAHWKVFYSTLSSDIKGS